MAKLVVTEHPEQPMAIDARGDSDAQAKQAPLPQLVNELRFELCEIELEKIGKRRFAKSWRCFMR